MAEQSTTQPEFQNNQKSFLPDFFEEELPATLSLPTRTMSMEVDANSTDAAFLNILKKGFRKDNRANIARKITTRDDNVKMFRRRRISMPEHVREHVLKEMDEVS